ncbi:MAG: sn-glycerol-3-phosphate dehydrogenase subunit C [candidate division BRC1 bacterium ADurb.BinA364]|nr:MAG: sn-glycerol-3-phosphate dehydrogenase subunit C [candidate division BRC1 bacterium ADurb.BinA364]
MSTPACDPISLDSLNLDFAEEIAREPGGEEVRRCFSCGMCTAGCPVREVDDRYSPRQVIRMILLGMREETLKSDFLWLCSNCFTCMERCPQGIRIPDIIRAAKNIAAREGLLPAPLQGVSQAVCSIGRLYEIEDFDNKKRAKSGLPELQTQLPEVARMMAEAKTRSGR